MDYVDWCEHVLAKLIETTDAIPHGRVVGVNYRDIARAIDDVADRPDDRGMLVAIHQAVSDLAWLGLVKTEKTLVKISVEGRNRVSDIVPVWEAICHLELRTEHRNLLHIVNRLSPQEAANYVWLSDVDHHALIDSSPNLDSLHQLWPVATELEELGLAQAAKYMGRMELRATYTGLVWETRRDRLGEARLIDQLLAEGETTSVEFKRELNTKTDNEKAEFIKDILGLVNTQARPPHLLLIGIDDKTREYHDSPADRITQDHLEQVLSTYTEPVVDIRYRVVQYPAGPVGKIEVLRDPAKLPYGVAKDIGGRKRVRRGQLFVRHGSQTEEATPAELAAIQAEGERARAGAV